MEVVEDVVPDRVRSRVFRARRRGWALLVLAALLPLLWGARRTSEAPVLELLQVVETHETLGVPDDAGLAFPPNAHALLVPDPSSYGAELQLLDTEDDSRDVLVSWRLADAVNLTVDVEGRVFLLDAASSELVVLEPTGELDRFDLGSLGLASPRGLAIDPAHGRLYVLDADRIVVVRPDTEGGYLRAGEGHVSEIPLPTDWVELRGLAFDSETGQLHVHSPETRELFQLDASGSVQAVRALPKSEGRVRAMVFAASRDATDEADRTSLYLAADGRRPPQTTEWSLHVQPWPEDGPVATPELVTRHKRLKSQPTLEASPADDSDPVLIQTIDSWRFNPPSPDSAGIAYVTGSHSLLMSDSEVNETSLYRGRNMFEVTPEGSLFRTWDTTDYYDEPTGVAYNPGNGHLYISDDSEDRIWIVDPRAGGLYGDGNDAVTSLDTDSFGASDPEGVAYSTLNGFLYVIDGVNREVYEVDPGGDGRFDTRGDNVVRHFDTLGIGVTDPEGITVDTGTGNLYIVGKPTDEVREVTPAGTLVRVLDISAADPKKPAGLAFGPTSIDRNRASLYIAARGVDNNKDPSENDGEIYEFSLGDLAPGEANAAPVVTAPANVTVPVGEIVVIDATVEDDGLPDPPGAIESVFWSQESGPGEARIDNPHVEETTVSFPVAGSYVLRLTAFDGQLSGSDTVAFTVSGANGEAPVDVRVAASSDDAEEEPGGDVDTTSSDLELTLEKDEAQIVGMRFRGLGIPQFATIESAWIQFETDETSSEATTLTIAAEATGDAAAFLEADGNLSSRPTTAATASWSPPAWPVTGEAGPAQRTSDLSAVLQEVVDRNDWAAGNDVAILITGVGTRVAESYDGTSEAAPLLHVEYSLGGGERNLPPTVEAGHDQTIEAGESTSVAGSVGDDGLPDPPGAIQSTTWSQLNGPPFASFATPDALQSVVTFPSEGSYQLRLSAFDGQKTGSDDVTITVTPPPPPPGQTSVEVRIASSGDDAEERGDLDMKLTSSDLEMTLEDGAAQVVGLRFHPLPIPAGARIDAAWVQFEVDEATSVQTDLRIEAEDSADALPFLDVDANLSERPTTGVFVDWQVPTWSNKGAAGPEQRTPDLADVIDSVVNGGGWQSGNALVLLVTGTGERVAESFDGDDDGAPLLHVTFTVD